MSETDSPIIAAVVLAAGLSTRMGRFKPLLPFGGVPMVAAVVESLTAVAPAVYVVTGHRRDDVAAALAGRPVRFIHNADYAGGEMVSSVQAGVRALPAGVGAFVLALADQPAVSPVTIRCLIDAWRRTRAAVVSPLYHGKRGHPVVIPSQYIPDILNLTPGETLKSFMERRAADILEIPVHDPAVRADVDTPEDYEHALRLWYRRTPARLLHLAPEPIGGAHAP